MPGRIRAAATGFAFALAVLSAGAASLPPITDISNLVVTALGGMTPRSAAVRAADTIKIADLGARCDGQSHQLSGLFGSLSAAQSIYPAAVALTDEVDWAATQRAVSQVATAGGGIVDMPHGTCLFSRAVSGPSSGYPNIRVVGQGAGTVVQPTASMSALFTVLTGFFDIQDMSFTNVSSFAAEAIEENKPLNNLPNRYVRNRYVGFSKAVRVISGDVFAIDDSFFNSNATAISLESYCVNGRVRGNYTLGGNGLDLPGSSIQQCEGVSVEHNQFLTGVAGAFGARILGGLQIDLTDNTIDQIISGPGVIIDASNYPVNAVTLKGGYIGAQGNATGATNGLQVINNANNVTVDAVTFIGWYGYDLFASGVSHLSLSDIRALSTADNANLALVNAPATTINGGFFGNPTATVVESGTTVTHETNAHFAKTPSFLAASQYINDYGNTKAAFTVVENGPDHIQIVSGTGTVTLQTQGNSTDRFLVLSSSGAAPILLAPGGNTRMVVGNAQASTSVPFAVPKLSGVPSTAPAAGYLSLFALAGSTTGTCKLMALAGTSTTPVTIADNIGSGC